MSMLCVRTVSPSYRLIVKLPSGWASATPIPPSNSPDVTTTTRARPAITLRTRLVAEPRRLDAIDPDPPAWTWTGAVRAPPRTGSLGLARIDGGWHHPRAPVDPREGRARTVSCRVHYPSRSPHRCAPAARPLRGGRRERPRYGGRARSRAAGARPRRRSRGHGVPRTVP